MSSRFEGILPFRDCYGIFDFFRDASDEDIFELRVHVVRNLPRQLLYRDEFCNCLLSLLMTHDYIATHSYRRYAKFHQS